MKALPLASATLCPQTYLGQEMVVESCTRCSAWGGDRCGVDSGAEHLAPAEEIPGCPISSDCQHSIQAEGLCAVRKAGLVCVSALVYAGMDYDKAMELPKAFHADFFGWGEE